MTNTNKAVSTIKAERKVNECVDCGAGVSVRVAQISKSKFGKVLCYSSTGACCQHNHKPVVKSAKKEVAATTPKAEKPKMKMTQEQFITKIMGMDDATKITLTIGQLKKLISASEASASVDTKMCKCCAANPIHAHDLCKECELDFGNQESTSSTEESFKQETEEVSQSAESVDIGAGHSSEREAGSVVYMHQAPDVFAGKKYPAGVEYVSPIYCTEGIGCKGCKGTDDAGIARAFNKNVSVQRDLAEAEAAEKVLSNIERLSQSVTKTSELVKEESVKQEGTPVIPELPEADEDMFAESNSNGSVTESYE